MPVPSLEKQIADLERASLESADDVITAQRATVAGLERQRSALQAQIETAESAIATAEARAEQAMTGGQPFDSTAIVQGHQELRALQLRHDLVIRNHGKQIEKFEALTRARRERVASAIDPLLRAALAELDRRVREVAAADAFVGRLHELAQAYSLNPGGWRFASEERVDAWRSRVLAAGLLPQSTH